MEGATCSSCAPMAVVSQSSVKFGKKRVFLVGTINFMTNDLYYNNIIII